MPSTAGQGGYKCGVFETHPGPHSSLLSQGGRTAETGIEAIFSGGRYDMLIEPYRFKKGGRQKKLMTAERGSSAHGIRLSLDAAGCFHNVQVFVNDLFYVGFIRLKTQFFDLFEHQSQ